MHSLLISEQAVWGHGLLGSVSWLSTDAGQQLVALEYFILSLLPL